VHAHYFTLPNIPLQQSIPVSTSGILHNYIPKTPSSLTGQKMNKAKAKNYKLINGFEEQIYQGCHHDAILLFIFLFCAGNKCMVIGNIANLSILESPKPHTALSK
jgi:hypothetical protein